MRRPTTSLFLTRVLVAGVGWWVLTDGAVDWSWAAVGVPAIAASAWVSAALMPPIGWSWRGVGRFAAFFLRESMLGGIDVARRALDPRMPLDPHLAREPLRMRTDTARVMVANTLGLLPGSLAVEVDEEELLVHALDSGMRVDRSIAATQVRVADLIREPAPPRTGPTEDPAS
ncbi:MAG: Na+/H+ antiporter subunit E [Gammaproteobacteria bacterium]|nr:Na+/H+ antiporter subunit E [Gammaproteobacteria bacterium]